MIVGCYKPRYLPKILPGLFLRKIFVPQALTSSHLSVSDAWVGVDIELSALVLNGHRFTPICRAFRAPPPGAINRVDVPTGLGESLGEVFFSCVRRVESCGAAGSVVASFWREINAREREKLRDGFGGFQVVEKFFEVVGVVSSHR